MDWLAGLDFVDAPENAFLGALRHRRHRVILVVECEIIKNVFTVLVHPANTVLDNDSNLECEGWIVSEQGWNGAREQQAVSVLVLQAFAGQCRAACRGAHQKSLRL